MQSENIFRLAMVLSGSQASSFKTNLCKLVLLVLTDNYPNLLTINNIIEKINDNFSMEFSDQEVLEAIRKIKKITIQRDDNDSLYNKYQIAPEEYQKQKSKQVVRIDDYIDAFIKEYKEIDEKPLNLEETKKIIYDFLYFTFNSDVQTVFKLIDIKQVEDNKEYCVSETFTPEEAKIINTFLNWDNASKNEFVLNLIAACFDYCMLTIKKDTSSFNNVFNGKRFYLDSNIIFRLAGFNKKERQISIDSFITKCTNAGIKICYTNHTNQELKTTIEHYVNTLKRTLGRKQPISVSAVSAMSSKYANLDFYEKYCEWCKSPLNRAGDFVAFKDFLEKKIKKVVSPFHLEVTENFESKKNTKNFQELVSEFTSYKENRYKNTYEGAIKVDINNYLYLLKSNENGQASNFLDLKNYFISADHCLTEWASIKRPGTVPIFVLPSVWYSILLKYKGRTDNDYASFCQFLNIRIAPERDIHFDTKKVILAYVMNLNEEVSIKEEIIFDIEKRLSSVNNTVDDPISFAKESHRTITQLKVSEAKQEAENNYKELLHKQIEESREQNEKNKKELFSQGQSDIIYKHAERIAKRNRRIYIILLIVLIIGMVALISSIIFPLFINVDDQSAVLLDFIDKYANTFTIIFSIVDFIILAFGALAKLTGFLSVDVDSIQKKLKKNYHL